MTPPLPADVYRERLAYHEARAAAEAARSQRYSRYRLLTAGIVALAIVGLVRTGFWPFGVVAVLGVLLFVRLVVRHDRVERRRDAVATLAALNRDALARLARRWDDLPPPWRSVLRDDHPYAADLDVFGHASLVQVLGPVRTPTGRRILSQWLLEPSDSDTAEIAGRQDAVRELAPQIEFRQQLSARVRHVVTGDVGQSSIDLPPVVQWAEAPDTLASRGWVPVAAVVLTVVSMSGAIGAFTGVVTSSWWLLASLLGWGLRWLLRAPIEQCLGGASGEHGLRPWADAIDHVHGATLAAPALVSVRADLEGVGGDAPRALRTLEQLVGLSDVRHSVWLYVPLQSLALWDLHTWLAIERWRRRHGQHVRRWLEAVGALEAIGGLASLSFDQPGWAMPVLDASRLRIEAVGVGHPLLADDVRVVNDVTVGPPGRFLLITGSNMSGKSTLLRAIGLNVVLAHAGGPACASSFGLPRLALHTSMRVSDSLELGLSLFMASLLRLQQIVVAARHATPGERTCYLLDEVLQGTNSTERQVAVRTVMGHLARCEAIGAITTHDLQLARDDAFVEHADSYHLQETLVTNGGEVTMTFDYRLRPGPAEAGNALHLVRLLGLSDQ